MRIHNGLYHTKRFGAPFLGTLGAGILLTVLTATFWPEKILSHGEWMLYRHSSMVVRYGKRQGELALPASRLRSDASREYDAAE